jgi:3,5-epimerase/4-reductase
MSQKFLIYGSKGWIGQQLISLLDTQFPDLAYICGSSRIDDKESLQKELDEICPTHVISFTGRTHGKILQENSDPILHTSASGFFHQKSNTQPNDAKYKEYTTIDYLEQPGKIKENVRDNLFGPIVLANLCEKRNIHFTYLGTGCIFEYEDETHIENSTLYGFTEESRPNYFGSAYSVVKGYTDELMHLYEDTVLNVRIRMPITADRSNRNFITKITTYEKICSVPNSMTVLPELLPLVIQMAIQKNTGTINLTNPGTISHNEILEMYREIVDPAFTWTNFSIEEQRKILAAGRSNNLLSTAKLSELFPTVLPIRESVRNILLEMAGKNK